MPRMVSHMPKVVLFDEPDSASMHQSCTKPRQHADARASVVPPPSRAPSCGSWGRLPGHGVFVWNHLCGSSGAWYLFPNTTTTRLLGLAVNTVFACAYLTAVRTWHVHCVCHRCMVSEACRPPRRPRFDRANALSTVALMTRPVVVQCRLHLATGVSIYIYLLAGGSGLAAAYEHTTILLHTDRMQQLAAVCLCACVSLGLHAWLEQASIYHLVFQSRSV